jgi:hypothetical protein
MGSRVRRHRLEVLARTLPFPVAGARLVPSNNNDAWRLASGYLRVAWRGDRGRLAREAQLLGNLTAADGDFLLHGDFSLGNVLARGGHVSALIAFEFARMGHETWSSSRWSGPSTRRPASVWPPDRAEADGLDPAHPLRTLRRLIDAPLTLNTDFTHMSHS